MKLIEFINSIEATGKLWFIWDDAQKALNCSKDALEESIRRLIEKKKIVNLKPRSKIYFILPLTHQLQGVLPPDWIVDPIMKHLNLPYYVGLLSAAQIHGAAHHAPQTYQVMTNEKVNSIGKNNLRIVFYRNSNITETPTKRVVVKTGYINVSTPEATVLDLVKYYKNAGYMDNVATLLIELMGEINGKEFEKLLNQNIYDLAVIQRLGFLLSLKEVGEYISELQSDIDDYDKEHFIVLIKDFLDKHKTRYIPLMPCEKFDKKNVDHKWKIFINHEVGIDL